MTDDQTIRLTRRELLQAAIGATGTAALGGSLLAAPPAGGRPPIKIGCGTVTFRKRPLAEALRRIRRAGYAYCETQAVPGWCPHVDPWKDDPAEFRRLTSGLGFQGVTGLWSPHGAIIPDPKCVEGITQAIRWAKEAGIPVVHAGDGHKPKDMSETDAFKLLADRLAAILEAAEKCGVCLAIEPHGTFSVTADGLKKIMGLSNSKWLGINYDTANVHHAHQDEVATLKAIVDRVVHVHVKDSVGSRCVVLGKGEVDVLGCLRVLRQHGYAGVFSLETEGAFDADEGQRLIEASRAYLVQTLGSI
jgi:sugar phosphate isomerase/epimerase